MTAHRAPDGEGALPARIAPPPLHKVRDNGLARTPPMGWNSWNKFSRRVDDTIVRGIADAMARNGMSDAGYVYINIDDTWEGERDAKGIIGSNTEISGHEGARRLRPRQGPEDRASIPRPGPNTCAGYEGSYGHEEQDARTWAAWGIDYLKYDWCGARNIYTDTTKCRRCTRRWVTRCCAAQRPIVFSLCQYGRADVWKWGPEVGGNLWRTTGDIRDTVGFHVAASASTQDELARIRAARALERSGHARDRQRRHDRDRVSHAHEPVVDAGGAADRGQRSARHAGVDSRRF